MSDRFGSYAEARIALARQALAANPDSSDLQFTLAEAVADAGDADEFARLFRQAYLLNPSTRPSIPQRLTPPGAARLRAMAQALIARGVRYSPVLAAAAAAAAALGDRAEVDRLVDYGRFFRLVPQVLPDGFGGDFHAALAAEIKFNLKFYDVQARAIRKAWRNNHIMDSALPACRAFAGEIARQVDRYIAALRADDDHPFIASRPAEYRIGAWAVLSQGEGHHLSHIHPRAWMSGVYYVVRPAISRTPGNKQGWLRVGPPHIGMPEGVTLAGAGWQERLVEPEPGNLVLMPGYFYHETQPTGAEEERICIAFDVMPLELTAAKDAEGETGGSENLA